MDNLKNPVQLTDILSKAPGNPNLWELFLAQLTKEVNCASGAMLITDKINSENTQYLYHYNVTPSHKERYEKKFNVIDTFNFYISQHPFTVFCNQTVNASHVNTEVESNFMIPNGCAFRFGLSIPYNNRYSLNLYFYRSTAFTEQELYQFDQLLQFFIQQLQKALLAEQRHNISSQIANQTCGQITDYIIVDRSLKLLFHDPVFSSIIANLDCVCITDDHLEVLPKNNGQCLMSQLDGLSDEIMSVTEQCSSCNINLIPTNILDNLYAWEFQEDAIILAVTNETEENTLLTRLIKLHKLTKCEAICALHFIENPSIPDIANDTNRSQDTVRNHLKRIMQKLDVHSQAALMKKLIAMASL
jgi:DNA-binding CsgD family transcriptional regulator